MEFIKLGKLGDTRWSGYLLTLFFIVLVFGFIGQLPMTIDALFMDKGGLVEQGTHQELMVKQGFYFKLYSSQFSEAGEVA